MTPSGGAHTAPPRCAGGAAGRSGVSLAWCLHGDHRRPLISMQVSVTPGMLSYASLQRGPEAQPPSSQSSPPLYSVLLRQSLRSISAVPAMTSSSSRASNTETSLASTTCGTERVQGMLRLGKYGKGGHGESWGHPVHPREASETRQGSL